MTRLFLLVKYTHISFIMYNDKPVTYAYYDRPGSIKVKLEINEGLVATEYRGWPQCKIHVYRGYLHFSGEHQIYFIE